MTAGPHGPDTPLGVLDLPTPVVVRPGTALADVARLMISREVSAVLVDEGGTPTDELLLTERDVVRALAEGCGPDTPLRDVPPPVFVRVPASMAVLDAAEVMLSRRVRHLVVVEPEGDVAIATMGFVLAVLTSALDPAVWLVSLRIAQRRAT